MKTINVKAQDLEISGQSWTDELMAEVIGETPKGAQIRVRIKFDSIQAGCVADGIHSTLKAKVVYALERLQQWKNRASAA